MRAYQVTLLPTHCGQAFDAATLAPLQDKLPPAMRHAGWLALPRHATGLDSGHYMYVHFLYAHGGGGGVTGGEAASEGDDVQLPFFTRARDALCWWSKYQAAQQPKRRRQRCGGCDACLRSDCGACASCADKPAFGGRGLKKQVTVAVAVAVAVAATARPAACHVLALHSP